MAHRKEIWLDIDSSPRSALALSFQQERQRIVRALYQIRIDMDHWNEAHPHEEPLNIALDFTNDIAENEAYDAVRAEKRKH